MMGLVVGLATMPLSAGAAVLDAAVFGERTELSVFDAAVEGEADLGLAGDETLSLAVGFDGGGPAAAEGGFELMTGGGDVLLDGELTTLAAPGGGTLELAFGGLGGPAAGGFEGSAAVTLDFGGALGADPSAAFEDGGAYEVSVFLNGAGDPAPAPIPLPASGLLVAAALGGLGLVRSRRTPRRT